MGAPLANGGLIKKVYFPREVLTASVVASWAVQFLIELGVLLVALLFVGNVAFAVHARRAARRSRIQTVFIYGLALGLGAVNVYFRDVQHFLGLALQMWFYATPVVYPLSLVPTKAHLFGRELPFGDALPPEPDGAVRRDVPRLDLRPAVARRSPTSPTSPASPS